MTSSPLVSVGLVTYNSATTLPDCLASLAAQQGVSLELIVVDNASSDDSLATVRRCFPEARILANTTNLGFSVGHNQAIRLSVGKYYLPLNPDIVLNPGYLAAAVAAMQSQPHVGLVAGKLLLGSPVESPARIDSTGLFIDRKRRQYLRGFGQPDVGQFSRQEEVFGVDGAAPLYLRAMLDDIQIDGEYFDESFFMHKEDVDLCWRARLLGWRCIFTPAAVAYHRRTFRPGQREKVASALRVHAIKNRYLVLIKNESRAAWRRDWLKIVWYDLKIVGYLLLFERSSLPALGLLRQNWRLAWQRREKIWARAKVTQAETLDWFRDDISHGA